jgi:hypothetical protein
MESRASLIRSLNSALLAFLMCLGVACDSAAADQFSFSARDAQDQAKADEDAANQAQAIQALVSVPCRQRVKNQKILLLIGEHNGDQWATAQDRYGPLFHVLQSRLMALGLRTVTQEEIKASIKQAEIDAYFKNDADAAFAASKRLGAQYVLRGSISSQTGVNSVVQVNEVAVNIDLTLSGAGGHVLSDVSAHSESYSGSDTLHTALALVREQADPLVAQLYNDYCRGAAGH